MNLLLAGQTFTDKFIHAFCWMLIHSLWQGMLLSLFAGIVVLCTKRSTPVLRYRLLSGLFLVFMVAAAASFYWQWQTGAETSDPLQQAFVTQKEAVQSQPSLPQGGGVTAEKGLGQPAVYNSGNAGIPNRTDLSGSATPNIVTGAGASSRTASSPSYPFWDRLAAYCNSHAYLLVMVWFVLFSIKCLRIVANIGYMQRLRNTGVKEPPAYWKSRVRELSDRLQIKRRVALLESELAKVPMMAGFFKPVILVPIGLLAQLPADQVEAVLLHELAHIRRKDYLVNMLQHFAEIIFFFNPGVLWLSSLLREEREHCCDDMAIGETKDKQQFIHALVSFQEYQLSDSSYTMGFPGSGKGHLLQRVRRIVYNDNKTLDIREKIFLLVCLFVTGVMTLAFSRTADNAGNLGEGKNGVEKTGSGKSRIVFYKASDTIPGKSGIAAGAGGDGNDDFPPTDHYGSKEGIKILGDTVTYYSQGYEIVTMDSTVKALYYAGARIPNDRISHYVDIINQIILEKNIRMQESRGPVPAGMTREDWDKEQSERDKKEADLARQNADLDRERADLERAKSDMEGAGIAATPVPPVPDVTITPLTKEQLEIIRRNNLTAVPNIIAVPLTKAQLEAVSLDPPELVQEKPADTLPGEAGRRMQELQRAQRRLESERERLDQEQQRLNREYARIAEETNRLAVQNLYSRSDIRLDTLQISNLSEMAKANHLEARRKYEAMLRESHDIPEKQKNQLLKDEEKRWRKWYKESRLEYYKPVKPLALEKAPVPFVYKPANTYRVRPIKPFLTPGITSMIASLLKDGIITDTLHLSFSLDAQVFIVNGIQQSDELRDKYKAKYFKGADSHVAYSRIGSGTSITEHNIDLKERP
ncbi:MAG: M56 family metallopeptidase [Puia sp.]|nr:M56 family metallopeptidase [Puia sp.]